MTEKTKNNSLSQNLDETEKIGSSQMGENNAEELKDLEKSVAQLKILIKGLQQLAIIIFAALVISVAYIIFGSLYNEKVEEFNNDIKDLRTDSIVRKILEIKEIKAGDSTETSYNYLRRDEKIVTYNQLAEEVDSLEIIIQLKNKKYNKLNDVNAELQRQVENDMIKLSLAKDNYDINYIDKGNTITIISKKTDSAYILLEAYRKRMHYDPKNKNWSISSE